MKTKLLKTLLLISLFMFSFAFKQIYGQVWMHLTVTDNGSPAPASGDIYCIYIDVVQINQFGVIVKHFIPNNSLQSTPYPITNNLWNVDVSCSDGPMQDVEACIFRVDFFLGRKTGTSCGFPYTASNTCQSPCENSSGFYNGFNASCTIK